MRVPFLALASIALSAQSPERPVRAVTDPGVVTTRQAITPAGVPTVFQGKVHAVSFGSTPSQVWVLTATHLYQLDWRENRVLALFAHKGTPGLQGLSHGERPWFTAVGGKKAASLFTVEGGALRTVAAGFGSHITGSPVVVGKRAFVPLTAENRLAVIDLDTGAVAAKVETGIAPFGVAVNRAGTVAYVTNWGGRRALPGELVARTGLAKDADEVVVDSRGIAATGTITRIDLRGMRVTDTLPAELHPTALVWDEAGRRLYVANNNRDSVTVLDTRNHAVIRHVRLQPFREEVTGIAPTALALDSAAARLYVACGGINAVAVVDTRTFSVLGYIPAGWYPSSLALSPDARYLAVGALLGAGSGWRDEPRRRFVHAYRGMVSVLPVPGEAELAAYTLAVSENNRLPLRSAAPPAKPARAAAPRAIPLRPGDPSLIQHVVYIVKENRTYDQVLGDIPRGNGDPSLVLFGRDVTPNHHRLAEEFVLFDNFYATGGNSADGHQWLTQANEVAYTLYPGYQGRSYPFDGTDPIAIAQAGAIWDLAARAGKTVRIYGEYAGRLPEPAAERIGYLKRWRDGEDFAARWFVTAPVVSVNAFLARNYPPYTNAVPDVVRAQIFLKDLKQWEAEGRMPHLVILQLPCDHTYGATPGASTPRAMVADNDLALGRIIEGLSHSRFWPRMAIFVVEDDAQNGVDHVDGHRTVALVASPYARRGAVDSTFYSQTSLLKTIELILGLPPLSLFDLIANDMRAAFTDVADPAPFRHLPATWDLFEVNPELKALRGEARRAAADSARMRWDVPDAAPTDRLNRILWHSLKGWRAPYPGVRRSVFAPYSLDLADDER